MKWYPKFTYDCKIQSRYEWKEFMTLLYFLRYEIFSFCIKLTLVISENFPTKFIQIKLLVDLTCNGDPTTNDRVHKTHWENATSEKPYCLENIIEFNKKHNTFLFIIEDGCFSL